MRVDGVWTVWISKESREWGVVEWERNSKGSKRTKKEDERGGTEEVLNSEAAEVAARRGEERRGDEERAEEVCGRQLFSVMRILSCVETTTLTLARHVAPAGSATRQSVAFGVG